jgi:tRNA(adenine34) deaminase
MSLAYEQAQIAAWNGEVPVGAIIVSKEGQILSQSYNLKEKNFNSCAHAEILAIEEAGKQQQAWRLTGCSIFVTLEPCPMCLSAMVQSRIEHLYFGAYDPKGGAISLGYNMYNDDRFNHEFKVTGGILHYNCSQILSNFFKQRRAQYKSP